MRLMGIVHRAARALAVVVQSFGVAMWRDLARGRASLEEQAVRGYWLAAGR